MRRELSVKKEFTKRSESLERQAFDLYYLALQKAYHQALVEIIDKYFSHLPKFMFENGENSYLTAQICEDILYIPNSELPFCQIHPEFLPLGDYLPIPVGDVIQITTKTPEWKLSILQFIEDHKDSEEEIHLAEGWNLLRYQGIWAAGGQEDDNWTDHEILSDSKTDDILESMDRKLAFGRETVLRNFRIFHGIHWHDVVFVNLEGQVSNEYYKDSAGTFKIA